MSFKSETYLRLVEFLEEFSKHDREDIASFQFTPYTARELLVDLDEAD